MKETRNDLSYEKIIQRLDEILEMLTKNELNLDQSMELYEEGAGLYRKAKEILKEKEDRAFEIVQELNNEPSITEQITLDEMEEDH